MARARLGLAWSAWLTNRVVSCRPVGRGADLSTAWRVVLGTIKPNGLGKLGCCCHGRASPPPCLASSTSAAPRHLRASLSQPPPRRPLVVPCVPCLARHCACQAGPMGQGIDPCTAQPIWTPLIRLNFFYNYFGLVPPIFYYYWCATANKMLIIYYAVSLMKSKT